ncbi:1,2-phenylacetyl-CoA epoxidase subunit PaaC [Chitinophaga sp. GCM10012297]|uniref:Phenylacetate-CoA oxygenase subunit PaaC n=1 Tax=Chitinophaga chungangae TaxID=2821488 RepID=A0ABS3YDY5_9BACT|nr:1,2-phenylacetyl-CoA epoxidase subunit PaaC [Chitinophaga chungangae]MBO9152894.1 phenylacetate-CoA oxygenase subunit PaaC [Chitinophaga chungangae]
MTRNEAISQMLTAMADDALIQGHRNSEWTGLGPIMEEDIAFSSMAQDKIGHAWALYRILHENLGGTEPDRFAFLRGEKDYRCCHLVEMPNGEYDFSLVRHFLFDHAEAVRWEHLQQSTFEPLALTARKLKGEIKYHTLHANAWITQLCRAGEESYARMQSALNVCFPLALGIFEPSPEAETLLVNEKIYAGEATLKEQWLDRTYNILSVAGLNLPSEGSVTPAYGGRKGYHTEYLQPLLDEMGYVFRLDPEAVW